MTAQYEVEKNCQQWVCNQTKLWWQTEQNWPCFSKEFLPTRLSFPCNFNLPELTHEAMSMSCAKADVRISDDLQLENSTSTSVWTTYLYVMPDFPLLVGIYAIAWECWPAEVHFSWILHRNKYWHGQYISWTSHICSRGFPYSPFERNNHNGDIIMVFSAVPLRYI
jgi:hypothetical protein